MKQVPPFANRDRVTDAVLIVLSGVAQAAALAIAAFATRDAFAALHMGASLSARTVGELALAGLVAAACLLFARRRAEALGQSYAISLRRSLYTHIARLPKSRHSERSLGGLSLRFVGDLSAARLWFGRGLPDVLTAIVVLPAAVAILYGLAPTLATVGLIPLGAALLLMAVLAWHLERRHRTLRQRRAGIAIKMIERIAIAPELDQMGRTEKELRGLDQKGEALRLDAVARRSRTAGLQAVLQAGAALSGLTILWTASVNAIAPATVAASLSVLALVALPLQDLGAAWDKFCAWRIAEGKAGRLLSEQVMIRKTRPPSGPAMVTVNADGAVDDVKIKLEAGPNSVSWLPRKIASDVAQCIAGLNHIDTLDISFHGNGREGAQICHIADAHVGLRGSLRRTATLMSSKRPKDTEIMSVLEGFGLGDLARAGAGLDQRIAENGKNLTAAQTLRLDLARAVLGRADVIVIASLRWSADPETGGLLKDLQGFTHAPIIIAQDANGPARVMNERCP